MSTPSAALDLRLLLPALVAWAFTASALGWSMSTLLAVAAAALVLPMVLLGLGSGRSGRGIRRDGPSSTAAALSLAAVALVAISTAGHLAARSAGPLTALAQEHAVVAVEGVVATEPIVRAVPGRDAVTVRFRLTASQVTVHGSRSVVHSPVLVMADERWQHVRWREGLQVRGKLVPAEAGDDVVAVLRPTGSPASTSSPGAVERGAERLRAGLREAASPLPADARGLLPALVIGDTSRTPPDLTAAMLATGMTHLSAVSGSNVAIVLAFALGGAGLLGVRRRWRPYVAAAALAGFVVLARPEPSVIRAATMGAIGLIGLSRSRRAAGIPVLSAAVLVLLVVDPWLSRSYGFALSTLATLGLLLFTRSWGEAIGRRLPGRIRSWGPAMAIPVAAQAMCAPVVVLLQGSVSVVGVLANLLAAPLVAPATVCGVAAALVAPLWLWGATSLCWLGALPALGIAWVARTCATVPGGTMPWPDGAVGAVLLALVTVAVITTGRWWAHTARTRPVAVLSAGLLVVAAAAPTSTMTWPAEGWRFVACDVGQGDGLVLATTPGHAVLVDAGPDPAAINQCLRRLDIVVLDSVVITHFHADHVDGLPGAIARSRGARGPGHPRPRPRPPVEGGAGVDAGPRHTAAARGGRRPPGLARGDGGRVVAAATALQRVGAQQRQRRPRRTGWSRRPAPAR